MPDKAFRHKSPKNQPETTPHEHKPLPPHLRTRWHRRTGQRGPAPARRRSRAHPSPPQTTPPPPPPPFRPRGPPPPPPPPLPPARADGLPDHPPHAPRPLPGRAVRASEGKA